MPYIAIRSYPKDEETRRRAAEMVCRAITEAFDCPADWVTVTFEEVAPEDWDEKVERELIEPNKDKIYIRSGVMIHGS